MATTEKYNYPCFLPGAFLQRSVLKGNSRSVQIYKCQNGSCAKFTEVESKFRKSHFNDRTKRVQNVWFVEF